MAKENIPDQTKSYSERLNNYIAKNTKKSWQPKGVGGKLAKNLLLGVEETVIDGAGGISSGFLKTFSYGLGTLGCALAYVGNFADDDSRNKWADRLSTCTSGVVSSFKDTVKGVQRLASVPYRFGELLFENEDKKNIIKEGFDKVSNKWNENIDDWLNKDADKDIEELNWKDYSVQAGKNFLKLFTGPCKIVGNVGKFAVSATGTILTLGLSDNASGMLKESVNGIAEGTKETLMAIPRATGRFFVSPIVDKAAELFSDAGKKLNLTPRFENFAKNHKIIGGALQTAYNCVKHVVCAAVYAASFGTSKGAKDGYENAWKNIKEGVKEAFPSSSKKSSPMFENLKNVGKLLGAIAATTVCAVICAAIPPIGIAVGVMCAALAVYYGYQAANAQTKEKRNEHIYKMIPTPIRWGVEAVRDLITGNRASISHEPTDSATKSKANAEKKDTSRVEKQHSVPTLAQKEQPNQKIEGFQVHESKDFSFSPSNTPALPIPPRSTKTSAR